MTVTIAALTKDGAGTLTLAGGDNLDLFVDVDYQKGGGLEAKSLGAGVRWRWRW